MKNNCNVLIINILRSDFYWDWMEHKFTKLLF